MTLRGNVARQTLALGSLAFVSLLSGCPQSTMLDTGADAGEGSDVPVIPRDAPMLFDLPPEPDAPRVDASSVDASAPEPCTTAGVIENVACGMCGTQDRFCTSGLTWEYTACMGERGECMAGSTRDSACGRCGTTRERCDLSCTWVAGACTGETGMCTPGQIEVSTMGCAPGEIHRRTCDAMCGWGAFDTCTGSPDDLDGDSFGGAVDCDDTNAAIFPGSTQPCGNFICPDPRGPGGFTFVQGTRTCDGPGFSACMRPPMCPEAPDSVCTTFGGMGFESRPCPRGRWDCRDSEQTRVCEPGPLGLRWSTWAPATCPTPVTTPPPGCEPSTPAACGLCGEGLVATACNLDCVPVPGECLGRGCTPGVRTRTTMGCAAGEYREALCSASCTPGTLGPCMPFIPQVDVMLLVDNTGSHTATVMASAAALATELVAPLTADMDVRVGLSSYADFPVGAYGGAPDEPFRGLLVPTNDSSAVRSALLAIPSRGGGDGPEALIEGLAVLADLPPHPMSFPFTSCPSGTTGGGCWRTGAQRVIVVITDVTGHGMPDTRGGFADSYGPDLVPPAPAWPAVSAALVSTRAAVFYIIANPDFGGLLSPRAQAEAVVSELGMDPAQAVESYLPPVTDLGPQARALAPRIAAYVGSMLP